MDYLVKDIWGIVLEYLDGDFISYPEFIDNIDIIPEYRGRLSNNKYISFDYYKKNPNNISLYEFCLTQKLTSKFIEENSEFIDFFGLSRNENISLDIFEKYSKCSGIDWPFIINIRKITIDFFDKYVYKVGNNRLN